MTDVAAAPSIETELKFDVAPAHIARLRRHPLLAGSEIQARARRLTSIYFDTPDQALRRAGFSLRVRGDGTKWVQTLKHAGAAGGCMARPECETPVAGPMLDVAALAAAPVAPALTDAELQTLAPLFTLHVQRIHCSVRRGTAEIDVAIDRGHVVGHEADSAFAELELELRQGALADLYALARAIDAEVPLLLSRTSKADRGYACLDPAPAPAKPSPVQLDASMDAGQGFQLIAHACFDALLRARPRAVRLHDPQAVHQMRVALRRLRSAMWLCKSCLKRRRLASLLPELRWLASALSATRDLDVLAERMGSGLDPQWLAAQRRTADATREAALTSDRFRRLLIELAAWIDCDGLQREAASTPMRAIADRRLSKLWRVVAGQGRHLMTLSEAERHQLRKRIKKLRYCAEYCAGLYPGAKAAKHQSLLVDRLARLQDSLGGVNDIAMQRAALDLTEDKALDAEERALLKASVRHVRALERCHPFWNDSHRQS